MHGAGERCFPSAATKNHRALSCRCRSRSRIAAMVLPSSLARSAPARVRFRRSYGDDRGIRVVVGGIVAGCDDRVGPHDHDSPLSVAFFLSGLLRTAIEAAGKAGPAAKDDRPPVESISKTRRSLLRSTAALPSRLWRAASRGSATRRHPSVFHACPCDFLISIRTSKGCEFSSSATSISVCRSALRISKPHWRARKSWASISSW